MPLLVGWCGGPAAAAVSPKPHDAVVDDAVRSIAAILGTTPRAMARRVRTAYTHDWTNDPFSRGCYSYARVGGAGAAQALARPVRRTLHFAGEHAYGRGRYGMVDGAIASGERAAMRVVQGTEAGG